MQIGTLFYTWLLQLLLPVMLATLVAEKEGRLRTMMKMHGLGDGAYWAIQYTWYFVLNFAYTWVLIGAGSAIGKEELDGTIFENKACCAFCVCLCVCVCERERERVVLCV